MIDDAIRTVRRIRPPRPALIASLAASVVIHAAALAWIGSTRPGPIAAEFGVRHHETVLTLDDPPPPLTAPPEPNPPEPIPPEPVPPVPPSEDAPEELVPPMPEAAVPIIVAADPVREQPPPPTPPTVAPKPRPRPEPARPPAEHPTPAPATTTPRPTVFASAESTKASRIVYVVDASGPMASSLAFVKSELVRSIATLGPDQSFQVLFFREIPPEADRSSSGFVAFGHETGSPQLARATPESKRKFLAWLPAIRPAGRSSPQMALEEALRLGPDMIIVLSRRIKRTNLADAASEVRHTIAALDRLNPASPVTGRRPVVIKTIQFLDDDPSGLLQTIAQMHGDGPDSYRLVTLEQVAGR